MNHETGVNTLWGYFNQVVFGVQATKRLDILKHQVVEYHSTLMQILFGVHNITVFEQSCGIWELIAHNKQLVSWSTATE